MFILSAARPILGGFPCARVDALSMSIESINFGAESFLHNGAAVFFLFSFFSVHCSPIERRAGNKGRDRRIDGGRPELVSFIENSVDCPHLNCLGLFSTQPH